MSPLLSIIIPSYNMERYLPKCLGSLVVDDADILRRLDIIVVNDGSADRTGEIAHEFGRRVQSAPAAHTPQSSPEATSHQSPPPSHQSPKITDYGVIRVIDKENGNYGSCINAALPLTKGKYVKILDADDTFVTDNIAGFLSFLENHDSDVIVSAYTTVDEKGNVVKTDSWDGELDESEITIEKFAERKIKPVMMHGLAYRGDLIRNMGYSQTEGVAYTDMEWIFAPFCVAKTITYCNKQVYCYLKGRAGQTVSRRNYLKNLWMQGEIALNMIRMASKYNVDFNSTRGRYLSEVIDFALYAVYRTCLLEGSRKSWEWCAGFDAKLKDMSPLFYRRTGEWRLSRIRIRYIRIWRKPHSRFYKYYVLYAVYKIAGKINLHFCTKYITLFLL